MISAAREHPHEVLIANLDWLVLIRIPDVYIFWNPHKKHYKSDGLTKSHTSYTVTIICDRSKSVAIRPKCGFLRITGLYRINNKTCGLLDLQDSLESSESTAKLGVYTLIKIIYNISGWHFIFHKKSHLFLAAKKYLKKTLKSGKFMIIL